MAEIEEPPILSLKERIAKLNQTADKPPVPHPQAAPRPAPVSSKTFNNPPSNAHGSVLDRSSIGNEPAAPEPRVSAAVPGVVQNGTGKQAKAPPPLPSRKTPPTLPRRPSTDPSLQRRDSLESTASAGTSASAFSSTTGRTTGRTPESPNPPPPSLPPRRSKSPMPPPALPSRPQSRASSQKGNEVIPPRLPHRQSSNASLSTTASTASRSPVPPPRLLPRTPPRTPSRDNSQGPVQNGSDEARPALPARKLPPPPPPTDTVDKIRQSGFSGSNRNDINRSSSNDYDAGAPPPVPVSSRPDLSKIQATKPRMDGSHPSSAPPTTDCLKCRDFSGPDTHAARYPRQSLPSQNIPWLANELTAPFPSHTDKARAIFTWLHHNVEYDVYSFFNNCVKPSTPAQTLATGMAVCEGYAGLFAALATHAGLEAMVVSGHGKGIGYADPVPGTALPPFNGNHAWNVVRIDNGRWKLIDPCWGAGSVQGHGQPYNKHFSPGHFTESNDEFGLRHYPSNRDQFFRDDGRPSISWEEYMLGNPNSPLGVEQPNIFIDAHKYNLGVRSFRPASKQIAINQQPQGPIRFQFSLICPHWTLEHHSKSPAPVFLLIIHGIDGRQDEYLPFEHWRGGTPGGGGDIWYLDVPDIRMLGAPGQTMPLAVLTSFGDRQDARGVTVEEYKAQKGRVGMGFGFVAQWALV